MKLYGAIFVISAEKINNFLMDEKQILPRKTCMIKKTISKCPSRLFATLIKLNHQKCSSLNVTFIEI